MSKIEIGPNCLRLGNLRLNVEAKSIGNDVAIYDKKRDVVVLHRLNFDDEGVFVRDEYAKWAAIHAAICYGGATEYCPDPSFELRNLADPELGKFRSRQVEYLLIHREIPSGFCRKYAARRIKEYEKLIELGEDLIPSFEESIDALKMWQHCDETGCWVHSS